MSNVMNIYAAGGAAMNIVSKLVRYNSKVEKGYACVETYFVDSSSSNLHKDIPEDRLYLVEGLDGSGKKRDSNYDVFTECCRDVLHTFKPAEINLVVHSCSGGSGSVLGTLLVSELLARGDNVIVLAIGSSGSKIEIQNTINTLKSLESISKIRNRPVAVHYRENSLEMTRGAVDASMELAIFLLATLFSGDNKELDSSDLSNFLNYPSVTSYGSKLTLLDFFDGDIDLNKNEVLVSLATLVDNETNSISPIPVEYQAVGYVSDSVKEAIRSPLPIHAGMITGYFNKAVNDLEEKLSVHDEARRAVNEKTIITDETATSEGIVL